MMTGRAEKHCGVRSAECGLVNPKSKISATLPGGPADPVGGQNPTWSRRGQSTLEYLLVGVAVLLAVLFGVKSLIQPGVEARMTDAGSTITKAGVELKAAVDF